MTWHLPISATGAGTRVDLFTDDVLFVAEGVTLASTDAEVVRLIGGSGQQVFVHGTIVTPDRGIVVQSATDADIVIGATGRVASLDWHGVVLFGSGNVLDNSGVVETLYAYGAAIMPATGSQSTIVNSGLIKGKEFGIMTFDAASVTLVNSGRIETTGLAYFDYTDSAKGSTDSITNTGTIIGQVALGGGDDLFDGRQGLLSGPLMGGLGQDQLFAGKGRQTIDGGEGNDLLEGGAGADAFVFGAALDAANRDRIIDFAAGRDEIRLDDAVFAALVLGGLDGEAFRASRSGRAREEDDRILYDTDSGWLRYDADGEGRAEAVAFARLAKGLALGADDFVVV